MNKVPAENIHFSRFGELISSVWLEPKVASGLCWESTWGGPCWGAPPPLRMLLQSNIQNCFWELQGAPPPLALLHTRLHDNTTEAHYILHYTLTTSQGKWVETTQERSVAMDWLKLTMANPRQSTRLTSAKERITVWTLLSNSSLSFTQLQNSCLELFNRAESKNQGMREK